MEEIKTINQKPNLLFCAKKIDGFFAYFFNGKISLPLVWVFAKLKIHPNIITILSFGMTFLGCFYILKERLILAAILLQLGFTLDCADGQLARFVNKKSPRGMWLDGIFDRAKDMILLFSCGLALFLQTNEIFFLFLMFLAIFLVVIRHYEYFIKEEVIRIWNLESIKRVNKPRKFHPILWETLHFNISERLGLISILLIFNKITWIFYIYIIWLIPILLFKFFLAWKTLRKVN